MGTRGVGCEPAVGAVEGPDGSWSHSLLRQTCHSCPSPPWDHCDPGDIPTYCTKGCHKIFKKINKEKNRSKIYQKQRLLFFRVFPSASRCLYRAGALPVSVRVCGRALEYLLSNDNMAFSFFRVFFPFPFLQPMMHPRNLPVWTSTPSVTQGPWKTLAREGFMYVDTCMLLLYIPHEGILRVTRAKLSWGMPVVTPVRQSCLFALQIPSQKAGWGLSGKIFIPSVRHPSTHWGTAQPVLAGPLSQG